MDLKQAKELVRSRLSDKRYEHTINVKKMAVKLAKHYGTDPEQAALAAGIRAGRRSTPHAGVARHLRRHSGAYRVGRYGRSRAQRHCLPYRRQGGHDPAG